MTRHSDPSPVNGARFAAVDLGAESGRVAVGAFDGERLTLDEVHRFQNTPLPLPDGLHWDVSSLFQELLAGLRVAGDLAGVGIDAWGCDYALLDGAGGMLGLPFHYRDERTVGMPEQVFARVPRAELYERTGIQHLPINTVYQLRAESELLRAADRIALIPDLFNFWLSGILVNEATIASTTALADPVTRSWARDVVQRLEFPGAPFAPELVEPGVELGRPRRELDLDNAAVVRTVASHDTAAAFAAAPVAGPKAAIISSGTWSLVGTEVPQPHFVGGLSNEWGVDGTIRLLRNVMGLWLLQECRRAWGSLAYDELEALAADASDDVALFDPDDETFLRPGAMPARIAEACARNGQRAPESPGDVTRAILLSLACKYRAVVDELRRTTGAVDRIHLVGGGARNALLCQLTANVVGVPVLAGPAEATALGNVLVQARAAGYFASLAEARECVHHSFPPVVYEPSGEDGGVFDRFLALPATSAAVHATI